MYKSLFIALLSVPFLTSCFFKEQKTNTETVDIIPEIINEPIVTKTVDEPVFDTCDITPIPDSILNNRAKLYHYFMHDFLYKSDSNYRIPCFRNDGHPFEVSEWTGRLGDYRCTDRIKNSRLICKGHVKEYLFKNEEDSLDSLKNYSFVKKIFSENIYDKHCARIDFIENDGYWYTKKDGKLDFEEYEKYYEEYYARYEEYGKPLYSDTSWFGAFIIHNIYYNELYTAFIIEVFDKNGFYGKVLLCTYDANGNFIDGIFSKTNVSTGYESKTYFDPKGNYHILIQNYECDDTFDNCQGQQIDIKYKLTKQGRFIYQNTKCKKIKSPDDLFDFCKTYNISDNLR